MQIRVRILALVATLLLVMTLSADAQKRRQGGRKGRAETAKGIDTVRLVYNFEPGMSVTYRVVTRDTISFWGANNYRVAAERTYLVTYECEAKVRDGLVMSMRYVDYVARKWRDTLSAVVRTDNPWMSGKYTFLMDHDGTRIRFVRPPVDSLAVAPAGPFQLLLLPYLGPEWTRVGAGEMFELNHWLLDNAVPPVLFLGSVFRSVLGRHDTLGVPTVLVEYAHTGRGSYEPPSGVTTSAITNGMTRIFFAPMLGLPVAGQTMAYFNLTLRTPKGAEAAGRQHVYTDFEMVLPASDDAASIR